MAVSVNLSTRTFSADDVFTGRLAGCSFKELLQQSAAVIFRQFFSAEESHSITDTIYHLKEFWHPNYGGEQYSLGRVWYTHVDEGIKDEYVRGAEESNRIIESHFPGLYERIRTFCAIIQQGEPVALRKGWAGPGFVIFPANGRCAEIGGDIHYDWEGLTDGQLDDPKAEAYSFISMLQKPHTGGGLRIWNMFYDRVRKREELVPKASPPAAESLVIDYEIGGLLVIDSFRLHQIQPFGGEIDRICLTFHTARYQDGWYVWF